MPFANFKVPAGTITAGLGEIVDSAVIFAVVLVNAVVGFIQESRAEAGDQAILAKAEEPGLGPADRMYLHHAAGKILNDIGRYDEAIDHFQAGKSAARAPASESCIDVSTRRVETGPLDCWTSP